MADEVPGGPDGPNNWGVIGVSREQWTLLAAALSLGGNVRAGLEDNFYLPDGQMARSNGELIAVARRMAEAVGRRAATVEETRGMLGLGAGQVSTGSDGAEGGAESSGEVSRRELLRHPIEASEAAE
jgi:uncharacterized protein (DUF849 family)